MSESIVVRSIERLGTYAISPIEELGKVALIWFRGTLQLFVPPLRIRLTLQQMEFVGVQSLSIILLSSASIGATFTLESWHAYSQFGAAGLVGGTVGVAITRELGPTITGLLVAGRAGSAMTAEIGAMRVSEQIDALEAMAVDPMNYLVKPRLIASVLTMPMLCAVFDLVGIGAAYLLGIYYLHMSVPDFMVRLQWWVTWRRIWTGLFKATVFGLIMGVVSCYKGFYTTGGAVGVGNATTSSVVMSSVAMLTSNFILDVILHYVLP